MWWPNHIPAGVTYYEMMSHIDCWATLAAMVGLKPPPHDWVGNDGKGIYFDSIDNSAYILGKAPHSARNSWVYIDGENFNGARFFLCPLARATRTAGGAVRIPAGSFATGRACIGSIR
jgi:hypothetical protein